MNVLILIPSYKRARVIDLTLAKLIEYHQPTHDVTICVADNKTSPATDAAIRKHKDSANAKGIEFNNVFNEKNIGKAKALNILLEMYDAPKYDTIVTMDNDMVVKMPWYNTIDSFMKTGFDFVGVGSKTFWYHYPTNADRLTVEKIDDFHIVRITSIAGGMLIHKPNFIRSFKWTNAGGVYGEDDGQMCRNTSNKAVLYRNEDWLDHDPLTFTDVATNELKEYDNKKLTLLKNRTYVFSEGWDEI